MWWSKASSVLLVAGLCLGCGFRPMYATGSAGSGPEITAEMAATAVQPIRDRSGQILRNELEAKLTPGGLPSAPRYVLAVGLTETIAEVAVQRTGLATRANLTVAAVYALRDADTGAIVLRGTTRSVSSYDLVENRFSTLTAENDARERAVVQIADNITMRLAVFYGTAGLTKAAGV